MSFFRLPFESATEEKVILFADGNLYGSCPWNDKWYKEAYGKAAFKQAAGRQPVCIGTVLATQEAMLAMLDEFSAFMARSPFGRIEQAIFNHMLQTGKFRTKLEFAPNITSAVATLGSESARQSVKIIEGPPAQDAIDRRDWPFLHETNKKRLVLLGEFAGRTRR
jgi:hypothetical protein